MAENLSLSVGENFDIEKMCEELKDMMMQKGYHVNLLKLKNGINVQISKGIGGINTVLGMGVKISAVCTMRKDNLMVNFSDAEWTSKIIGCVVGFFCCVPFITAIIGIVRQVNLPKEVRDAIMLLASECE